MKLVKWISSCSLINWIALFLSGFSVFISAFPLLNEDYLWFLALFIVGGAGIVINLMAIDRAERFRVEGDKAMDKSE